MSSERVFNPRARWLLRKRIPGVEVASGVVVLACLGVVLGWVFAQKDNYNPAERDLPFAVLAERPVEDRLYRTPFRPWQDPALAAASRASGGAPPVALGVFPREVLSGGWALSSRLKRFQKDTLFEKINGEAEKFIKLGFQELQYLALKSGAHELSVELFDQGGFPGALGIFSDHGGPGRKIRAADGVMYFTTPAGAIGMHGRFFFRIAGNSGQPAVRAKAEQIVRAFAALPVKPGETPRPFRILGQGLRIPPGRIAYQQHNVFQYAFARDFWFARLEGRKAGRLFLHQARNPREAARLFDRIAGEHAREYTALTPAERAAAGGNAAGGVTLRHPFLKTYFRMARAGNMVYGVERAPHPAAAARALDRLGGLLRRSGGAEEN